MIIELSPNFAAFGAAEWVNYHQAIENLITAHGQGWHLLSPARDVAASIRLGCTLSATQEQVFRHYISAKISELSGQARSSDMTILANVDGEDRRTIRANQIGVPLRLFSDLASCAPSRLITENAATDGKALELLARLMAKELGYGGRIQLELVHGGGGTTAACYHAACQSGRPTLCVLDSDKKYDSAPLGETARQVQMLAGTEVHPTVAQRVLPVRELENALPLSALLDVYANNPEVRRRVASLIEYAQRRVVEGIPDEANVLSYLDMKLGLRRKDIAKLPALVRPPHVRFAQVVSTSHRTRTEYDDLTDGVMIHSGVAEALLQQFVAFLEGPLHLRRNLDRKIIRSPAWSWLRDLLALVLAYGTAGQRLPVR